MFSYKLKSDSGRRKRGGGGEVLLQHTPSCLMIDKTSSAEGCFLAVTSSGLETSKVFIWVQARERGDRSRENWQWGCSSSPTRSVMKGVCVHTIHLWNAYGFWELLTFCIIWPEGSRLCADVSNLSFIILRHISHWIPKSWSGISYYTVVHLHRCWLKSRRTQSNHSLRRNLNLLFGS